MDLWNNKVGRILGLKAKTRAELADLVRKALSDGELIVALDDPRRFTERVPPKPQGNQSVIVLKENNKGGNEYFFDFNTSKVLSRIEFVEGIKAGHFPGYELRRINGVDFPVSKKDDDSTNNLG
jgi:hypothetical protein